MSRKMGDYINIVTSRGHRYNYARLPERYGVPSFRLPDDRDEAEEVVRKIVEERELCSLDLADREDLEIYVQRLVFGSKQRAKEKGLPHTIQLPEVLAMMRRQNFSCAVSGITFSLDGPETDPFLRAFAPSLDRVSSAGGYTPDNCRLVCRIVNFAMGKWGFDSLRTAALAIAAKEGWTANVCPPK